MWEENRGTYAMSTGYYELMIMLPDFRKILNNILHEKKKTFTFIGDIFVVTKRTKKEHMGKLKETIKVQYEAVVQLKLAKGQFGKNTE